MHTAIMFTRFSGGRGGGGYGGGGGSYGGKILN